jgi:hypothetical chaperone protein
MSEPIAYGVDFGTTNSAVSIAFPDRVEVLSLESQAPETQLPSIVYLHRDNVEAAGSEAVRAYLANGSSKTRCSGCSLVDHQLRLSDCRQYRAGGGCNDARIMSGLKEHLSDSGLLGTHSWARDFVLPDLVAVILRRLKRAADRYVGADVRRVVLGHPVNFPGTEGANYRALQGAAINQLEKAAQAAGFDESSLFPEPAAALVDEQLERGTVMALDFGGGTFDAALVRFNPAGGTVVALQGASIGGELFNAALFDAKLAPSVGLDDARVPAYIRQHLRTMSGARYLMSDPNFWGTIREVSLIQEIFAGGHVFNFYRAIEDAKIRLSTESSTRIQFQRPGIDMDIGVTRAELEVLLRPHIDVVGGVIDQTLEQAGESAGSIDLVIRTGGTSNIPLFVDMITDKFGPERVQARHSFDSVAHGLGSQAQLLWSAA